MWVSKIKQHFSQLQEYGINNDAIDDVIKYFGDFDSVENNTITIKMLSQFKKNIKNHNKTRKNRLTNYLNAILNYLVSEHSFIIEEKAQLSMVSKANRRFAQVSQFNFIAEQLHNACIELVINKQQKNEQLTVPEYCLIFLCDTAPLNISYLHNLISGKALYEETIPATVLFTSPPLNNTQRARYQLSPFSFRALTLTSLNNKAANSFKTDIAKLKTEIINAANRLLPFSYQFTNFTDLRRAAIAHFSEQIGYSMAVDIAEPKNQSSLTTERYMALTDAALSNNELPQSVDIYKPNDFDFRQISSYKTVRNTLQTQLTKLRNYSTTQEKAANKLLKCIGHIKNSDITSHLLLNYAYKLLTEGSFFKEKVSNDTVCDYLGITDTVEAHPISLKDALNSGKLDEWAHALLSATNDFRLKKRLEYFLRFLTTYHLTESLDVDDKLVFLSPSNIDANLITPIEHSQLINVLGQAKGNITQKMACQTTADFGFYAGMRRDEVARVRLEDLTFCPKTGNLQKIKITNTDEGDTKNGLTRFAYVNLSDDANERIKHLKDLHKNSDKKTPFFAFNGESMSMRTELYFRPVTLALRAVCGEQSLRFHHLRHSKATNSFFNLLKIHNPTAFLPPEFTVNTNAFCDEQIEIHKECWFPNTPSADINHQVLIDKLLDEIGHGSFVTTRRNYIPGKEWVLDACCYDKPKYSNSELRTLFNLPKNSTDIFRIKTELGVASDEVTQNCEVEVPEKICLPNYALNVAIQSNKHSKYKQPSTSNSHEFAKLINTENTHHNNYYRPFDEYVNLSSIHLQLLREDPSYSINNSSLPNAHLFAQTKDEYQSLSKFPKPFKTMGNLPKKKLNALKALLKNARFSDAFENKFHIILPIEERAANTFKQALSHVPLLQPSFRCQIILNKSATLDGKPEKINKLFDLKTKHIKASPVRRRQGDTQCVFYLTSKLPTTMIYKFLTWVIKNE